MKPFETEVEERIDALEIAAECEVESIEMLLVLDETGAREHVEVVERR